MEERSEFRIRIPIEFLEEVRLHKEGSRLEATDANLRYAFSRVMVKKGGELLKSGELYIKDVYRLVVEEAEANKEDGYPSSTIKISVAVPPHVFEKAGKIKKDYSGGQLDARNKDILEAVTYVLKGLASELLIEGEANIKDIYLLLLERIE